MANLKFENPFRPGAGQMPPHLAGREDERGEFIRLLEQKIILQNAILTGLRGVGKTVLLETFKPLAIEAGWLWVGNDLSESTSVTEEALATRILTDLAVVTSQIVIGLEEKRRIGIGAAPEPVMKTLDFAALAAIYQGTPGLVTDKLKAVLEQVWRHMKPPEKRGIIFAYDEAQNLADHAEKDQYPLSILLEVFMSIQRKEIPFMLVLTGLPTLLTKLVEARTYAERMFHQIVLHRLDDRATRDAIVTPIKKANCPVSFAEPTVDLLAKTTRGYPYFIQFVCREVFDVWIQKAAEGQKLAPVPVEEIMRKLDMDFFAGRWQRATDRQRELLRVISTLPNSDGEFTVQEVSEASHNLLDKGFSPSHVSQMLAKLSEAGLVYKNRWGKYSLAVPLLGDFIRRQSKG